MSAIKSVIKCTCPACDRVWDKGLLVDFNTLDETAKRFVSTGLCYECRSRRNELLDMRLHSRGGNE